MTSAGARAAEPIALTGDNLRQIVPGSAIALDTPLNTIVPIRFATDGLMTGEAGSLASYLGAEKDRGRWWIAGDQLCLKWFRWFDAEQRCLQLRQDGDRIYWQEQDGKSGTATITARAPQIQQVVAKAKPVSPPPVVASVLAAPSPPPAPPAAEVAAPAPAPSAVLGALTIISRAEAATPAPSAPPQGQETVTPEAAPAAANSKQTKKASVKPAPKKQDVVKKSTARDVKLAAKPASAPLAKDVAKPVESRYQVANVEEDDVLNIRNGPSEYHDAVGAIPPTARGVKIVGVCADVWCPVVHGGTKGWVNRYYLAPEPAPEGRRTAQSPR
ncbi:MAG: hypothetical protein Q7T86_14115 [Hyphomicrobiaceae bacterium]|nr:hypothetical protein [Hyphomicrobiaceae bacterium]